LFVVSRKLVDTDNVARKISSESSQSLLHFRCVACDDFCSAIVQVDFMNFVVFRNGVEFVCERFGRSLLCLDFLMRLDCNFMRLVHR
jgi:hypothetical protein